MVAGIPLSRMCRIDATTAQQPDHLCLRMLAALAQRLDAADVTTGGPARAYL